VGREVCDEDIGGLYIVSQDEDEHGNTRLPPGHLGLYFHFVLHKLENVVNLFHYNKQTKTNLP
jgi:hypothetical protein